MFNAFKSKGEFDAEEIAQSLVRTIILNRDLKNFKEHIIRGEVSEEFESKAMTYRLAIVLIVLLTYEKKYPKFEGVRDRIEDWFFKETEEGMSNLVLVKAAMEDIAKVMETKDLALSVDWAMLWLNEIGIKETNPARLTLFVTFWLNEITMVSDVFQKFAPLIK